MMITRAPRYMGMYAPSCENCCEDWKKTSLQASKLRWSDQPSDRLIEEKCRATSEAKNDLKTTWIHCCVVCFCFLGHVSIAPNHPRYSPLTHWVIDTTSICVFVQFCIFVFVYLCFVRQVSIALITDIPELTHWVIDTISIATHSMSFIHWTFNLRKEIVVCYY